MMYVHIFGLLSQLQGHRWVVGHTHYSTLIHISWANYNLLCGGFWGLPSILTKAVITCKYVDDLFFIVRDNGKIIYYESIHIKCQCFSIKFYLNGTDISLEQKIYIINGCESGILLNVKARRRWRWLLIVKRLEINLPYICFVFTI